MYMHYETQFLLVLCNSTINYNILKYVYDSLSFVNGIKFYESIGAGIFGPMSGAKIDHHIMNFGCV